ncbi:adenylate/guanylate cyclase domain-containing protein [Nocardia sp. NBC_01377]|uniref:adenylate/guanylate cyclase domain-containing protein n=1 Tax=Nocardia sp. NBC_01377 TaxID=2903595 RepID=UPI00386710B9
MYGLADPKLIPKIAFGISFSAIVVCASSYLVIEFALRPVTARVLEAEQSRRRRGIGVFARLLLVWFVGSAVPVAGTMVLAILALTTDEVSTARLAICVLALGGATLVFGLLLMTQTLSATIAPIRGVRTALRRVENGDLDSEVTVFDGTELGELQSGFNRMVTGLREREQIRDLFGKHVGQDVADAALAAEPVLGGVETEAAALFIDIIGSTRMAATRPATEIVEMLNHFFGIVVEEVERHGGLVNKFEGDAALCLFGTPAPLPDGPGSALACARAIAARLAETSDFTAAIGTSSGRVVAGNVGAHQRYEFTVIGDPVNEAARLVRTRQTGGRPGPGRRGLRRRRRPRRIAEVATRRIRHPARMRHRDPTGPPPLTPAPWTGAGSAAGAPDRAALAGPGRANGIVHQSAGHALDSAACHLPPRRVPSGREQIRYQGRLERRCPYALSSSANCWICRSRSSRRISRRWVDSAWPDCSWPKSSSSR